MNMFRRAVAVPDMHLELRIFAIEVREGLCLTACQKRGRVDVVKKLPVKAAVNIGVVHALSSFLFQLSRAVH